jgi:Ca2+-binding RTX toxin-like protein
MNFDAKWKVRYEYGIPAVAAVLFMLPIANPAFSATYTGTSGNDAIVGTNSADTITMNIGGFDYANGRDGNDRIAKTDGGHTMMLGGRGSDAITLTSTNGYMNAWIHGEAGTDIIRAFPETEGGSYFAEIFGGSDSDRISATDMTANIGGGNGNDVIETGGGRYTVVGNGGDDTIITDNESVNTLWGNSGADDFLCGGEESQDTVMDYDPDQGDTVSDGCEEVMEVE